MTKPHLSETNFRKWEPVFQQFFDSWPEPFEIDTRVHGLAPTTVAARLRDAKLSLQTYGWPTTINASLFLSRVKHIGISQTGQYEVTIYDREHRETLTPEPSVVSAQGLSIDFTDRDDFSCQKILEGLCCLHHYQILVLPSYLTNWPPHLSTNVLTSRYDVAFTTDNQNQRIILT